MPNLEPSRSAPNPSPISRPHRSRPRSNSANYPRLHHVFSAQHLDDASTYHGGDHDSQHRDADAGTLDSTASDEVKKKDDIDAEKVGEEEVQAVRMGIRNTRDLEANLEKKRSARSVKAANLVRIPSTKDFDCQQDN